MRRGHFRVSKEMMNSQEWPLIEAELSKVFELEAKETLPYGAVAFHGISHLFDEAIELSSPLYDAHFITVNNKPKFQKFTKI